jgi:hypothetical protein
VLKRIFVPKKEKMARGWRRLHNLYVSTNIIRAIKSGRMRWAGHVACMGEMRNAYDILLGEMKE